MIGIETIAYYIPETTRSNYELMEKFSIDEHFIKDKIGVENTAVKAVKEEASDLCLKAWNNLPEEVQSRIRAKIDCIVVVTQNPDSNIPHVSAKIHSYLEANEDCACFDISLGCSGYVYGLSIVESFLEKNGLRNALLFTADPYSKIVDSNDKNTALLFGDASSVTILGNNKVYELGKFTFGTIGKSYRELTCNDNVLYMNGRAIFEFAARYVPRDIEKILAENSLKKEEIDLFLFHQGSKYIIDTITKRAKLDKDKVPFLAAGYGNTVSSSIPIMLAGFVQKPEYRTILISGFGVGLSWSGTILKRV